MLEFLRLTKNPKTRFAVRCTRCYWQGCSSETWGGNPIADTGDYSEIECPKCTLFDTYEPHLNDNIPDVFNPVFWVLYWLKRPVILYRQWKYERSVLKWEKEMNEEYEAKYSNKDSH